MWFTIVEVRKGRLVTYEARIYSGKVRQHTHVAMSEGGVRTWLAEQGIPFAKQPRYLSVERG